MMWGEQFDIWFWLMLQQALAELQAGCLVQICLLATSVLLISAMRKLEPGSFLLSGR